MLNKIKDSILKNTTTILTVVSCIGVVATAIFSSRAGKKSEKILEEKKPQTIKDKIKVVFPVYILTALCIGATLTCIIATQKVNVDNIVRLTTAYAALESQFSRYKQKNIELNGDGAHSEIVESICDERTMLSKDKEKIYRFKESLTGEMIESTMSDIYDAFYHANRQFAVAEYCTFDWYLKALGINVFDIDDWEGIGWYRYSGEAYYGYIWIDFYLKEKYDNKGLYYEIMYPFEPHADE